LKFHAFHFNWMADHDLFIVIGIGCGRVEYSPEAKWLYSFRVFLLVCKVEILWTTGMGQTVKV
jgi:hypothetical protein